MIEERKPNLFIPGFPKCGTSALYSILGQHPEIFAPDSKEPGTYSNDYFFKRRERYFKKNYSNVEELYILDSSTAYIISSEALDRIAAECDDPKFIVIARDPVQRIVSHYNWLSKKGFVNKSFFHEIEAHSSEKFDFRRHYQLNYKAYLDCSMYGEKLTYLLDLFPKENLFITTQEALSSHGSETLDRILNFLDLESYSFDQVRVNVTEQIVKKEYQATLANKVCNRLKKEWMILNGFPRTQTIRNPMQKRIETNDDVYQFLVPFLSKDLELFRSLELLETDWKVWNYL
jgi:hypothetical protein